MSPLKVDRQVDSLTHFSLAVWHGILWAGGVTMVKKKRRTIVAKERGDTWVGRRPAIYKDRKKEQNRQGETRRPKHKKRYTEDV